MNCTNCGAKIDESSKLHHQCGTVINTISKVEQPNTKTLETREQYLANTSIKDIAQAKGYLKQLKLLFWIVFIFSLVVELLDYSEFYSNDLFGLLGIVNLGLIIYFIYFCSKVLKAEKISRWNALLCVFFAPLSWIYLYPLITDPLKIITGEKQLPVVLTELEKQQKATKDNKKFWREMWRMIGVFLGIVIIVGILIYFFV